MVEGRVSMKTQGQALSRFVVIDLTRVRSGPAAVRLE